MLVELAFTCVNLHYGSVQSHSYTLQTLVSRDTVSQCSASLVKLCEDFRGDTDEQDLFGPEMPMALLDLVSISFFLCSKDLTGICGCNNVLQCLAKGLPKVFLSPRGCIDYT